MRTTGRKGGDDPTLAIMGTIASVVGILVIGFVAVNWMAFDAATGDATAALAGFWFAFEVILVVVGLFMLYTYLMERLRNKREQEAFVTNAMENAGIRQSEQSSALALAKLSQERAKAEKLTNDAALSRVRLEDSQASATQKEMERLQKLVTSLQDDPPSDGWNVDFTNFDDDAVVIDQRM